MAAMRKAIESESLNPTLNTQELNPLKYSNPNPPVTPEPVIILVGAIGLEPMTSCV